MISNQYPPYFLGGDAVACQRLSEGLVKKGFKVSVIFDPYSYEFVSKSKSVIPKKRYIENGVNIYPLSSGPLSFFWSYTGIPSTHNKLEKLLKQIKPDLVHFHNFSAFGWGALKAAKSIGKPIFHTAHDFWIACPRRKTDFVNCDRNCFLCQLKDKKPPNIDRRDYVNYIDLIICPSQHMIDLFRSIYPDRNYIKIPVGIDDNPFLRVKKDEVIDFKKKYNLDNKIIGLFVGIVTKRKGILDLLNAMEKIDDNNIIIIIGENKININKIIVNKSLEKKILNLGWVNDNIRAIAYKSADYFILPSYWENCPSTIIEAMINGLPIITTNSGGIPEMLNNNAILIVPGDINSLTIAINNLSMNKELRKQLGMKSLSNYKKNFTLEVHLEKQIQQYINYLN